MQTQYRAIVPASAGLHREVGADHQRLSNIPLKKRKGNVRVACNRCRAKRSSCDGKRPACARCSAQNLICEYISANENETSNMALKHQLERLREDVKQHTDFVDHLLSVPEPEALATIRRLRSTFNPSSVLSSLEGAIHATARPSDLETARAILPRTDSAIEFELNMLHRSVCSVLKPLDLNDIDIKHLFSKTRHTSRPQLEIADEERTTDSILTIDSLPPHRGTSSKRNSPIVGPIQDRSYCDSRLKQLKISYWTAVPISDEFAACVLSYHFESYHAIFGCVDCGLFLSDLINHKLDYCSPFLLSAIMSFACQSYSTFDVRSSTLSVAFMREAEKLWRSEQTSDNPKNLAALCYLSMACTVYGNEQLRHQAALETRAMATRMLLIGNRPTDDIIMAFHQLSAEKVKEFAHVAWGVYGALT